MFNLGTVFLRAGEIGTAEAWFRDALRRNPDLVEAHQNLAALLQDTGRPEEAHFHRERAFRHAPLRVEMAPQAERRVLVLSGAGSGNVPIENLLPRRSVTRIKLFVEYATAADWAALPDHDLVFNAIGDADLTPPGPWQDNLRKTHRTVLNPPENVARTRRDKLPELLDGISDIVVPRVIRRTNAAEPVNLKFPVLMRPLGAHGGEGVALATSAAAIAPGEAYLTEYHDYRGADGYFRKYRVIFIGGVPYPYHLAISPHWLVHYFSADMQEAAWKRTEEAQFLLSPETVLGARGMRAIAAIGGRLGLDYAGVDFTLLPDGQVLVFEANATMVVHLDDCPLMFDYKHQAVPRIFSAFENLLKTKRQTP
jgi:tetratricopeptide (TPR) repeat protein